MQDVTIDVRLVDGPLAGRVATFSLERMAWHRCVEDPEGPLTSADQIRNRYCYCVEGHFCGEWDARGSACTICFPPTHPRWNAVVETDG